MKEKLKTAGIVLLAIVCYVAVALLVMWEISRSGTYPSGADTMCHVYKGDVLYQEICAGNWYPLFDKMWYNGVEMMRYWAPLPVYVLAGTQALAGGDAMNGYMLYVGGIFFFGALAWLSIGCRHKRPWMGAFLGGLWFFMPNNLYALFVEGNLPRALCMIMLPLFVAYIHDYLLEDRWSSLPKMIVVFALMALCHLGYAGMIALALLIFLLIYQLLHHQGRKVLECIFAIVLAFLLTGIWAYASLQGGITSTDSSQVMKSFFQDALVSLNPLQRIIDNNGAFYFGLAAFALAVFGMLFARRKSMPAFWMAVIIFFCTTTSMYSVLVLLPGSQYLWMLRFISIALCFILYGLLLWDSLRKPFVIFFALMLVLDTIPSWNLLYGDFSGIGAEDRFEVIEEATLIDKAKEITSQRLALMDASSLEATGAYLVSGHEGKVAATFGAGWQSAATARSIVQLNQSVEDGSYLYLFDRCLELGSDTVLVQVAQMHDKERDTKELDAAAKKLKYQLVEKTDSYRLYHRKTPQTFGVINRYRAIGIGTSAPQMSLTFPAIEETISTNLNDYTYEELVKYDVVYLAGFTYDNKRAAERMIRDLSDAGVRVVILADGIPVDGSSGTRSFLGATCHAISFSNGYPELNTIDGLLNCDLFPDGYTDWTTVYVNGLNDVWGAIEDLEQDLAFYGTVYNDNIIMIGLNLTYHYALTQDETVGALLSHAINIDKDETPERKVVPLEISYGSRTIEIRSDYDNVDTTLAYHDIFSADRPITTRNYLTYVDKGTTKIRMEYPYLLEGGVVSGTALLLTVIFLIVTGKRKRAGEN